MAFPPSGITKRVRRGLRSSFARVGLNRAFDVVLPSGTRTTLTFRRVAPLPADLPGAITQQCVVADLDLWKTQLADAHVIEAIGSLLGAIAAPATELECRNCHRSITIYPAHALPLAPLLRAPPSQARSADVHPLPRPVPIAKRRPALTFQLMPRTLTDRVCLRSIVGDSPSPVRIDAPLLRAMGLCALGDVRSRLAIARALEQLDDEAFAQVWDAIADAWHALHHPRSSIAPAACPHCAARHDLELPQQMLLPFARSTSAPPSESFPSLESFRARAAAMATVMIEQMELAASSGLEVMVEDGVPPCDEGGQPLLGSYTPTPEADGDVQLGNTSPFSIAVYYQTFRSMYVEDGPYDVEEELRETLEHELEHHLGFLRGNDPLAEEEREEIERERRELQGNPGHAEEIVAGIGWLAGDLARFWRATWPLWILVIGALLVTVVESC